MGCGISDRTIDPALTAPTIDPSPTPINTAKSPRPTKIAPTTTLPVKSLFS